MHADMKRSTALRYETGGKAACDLACCVDKVSNEVTPRVTLAGAASGWIQNETHFRGKKQERTKHECGLSSALFLPPSRT